MTFQLSSSTSAELSMKLIKHPHRCDLRSSSHCCYCRHHQHGCRHGSQAQFVVIEIMSTDYNFCFFSFYHTLRATMVPVSQNFKSSMTLWTLTSRSLWTCWWGWLVTSSVNPLYCQPHGKEAEKPSLPSLYRMYI